MRILLATDAWEPQVNGVVRTLTRVTAELRDLGDQVEVISPDQFPTFPLPTYPEIKLAVGAYEKVQERFKSFEPEAIHIATEGPLGLAARRICLEWKLPFTTSYHTRFPEYVSARLPLPLAAGYAYMRWFHRPSGRLMVATPTMREELDRHGFRNLSHWSRGVDTELFHPRAPRERSGHLRRPRAAGLAERRAGGGGKEHRGLRQPRPARRQDRGRRRSAARGARAEIPRGGVHRREVRRRPGRLLRLRRCVRVPLAHRHIRAGLARGHGGRDAGDRLFGPGPGGPDPRIRRRDVLADGQTTAASGKPALACPDHRPRERPRPRRAVLLAGMRRGVPATPATLPRAGKEPLLAAAAAAGAAAQGPADARRARPRAAP